MDKEKNMEAGVYLIQFYVERRDKSDKQVTVEGEANGASVVRLHVFLMHYKYRKAMW